MSKPSWPQYFLNIAIEVSKRSPDVHTKCGCVLTNKKNRIIGTGYNGFPGGINDELMPLDRPGKYPYIFHSEEQAILNKTSGKIYNAYITGEPCSRCLMRLYIAGTKNIYWINYSKPKMLDEKDREVKDLFLKAVPKWRLETVDDITRLQF